jgi:hypothetical protein
MPCSACERDLPVPYRNPEDPEQLVCQACYRRLKRHARGLQKPGRKTGSSKVPSRSVRRFATEDHCANGHPWEEGSYRISAGRRVCKICARVATRKDLGMPPLPEGTPILPIGRPRGTHCRNGHEFTEENTYVTPSGSRKCRTCEKLRIIRQEHGLSSTQYESLLAAQEGRCAICRVEFLMSHERGYGSAVVDHDHRTERIRGLLCHRCNIGLGQFRDSSDLLRAAVDYLDASSL